MKRFKNLTLDIFKNIRKFSFLNISFFGKEYILFYDLITTICIREIRIK